MSHPSVLAPSGSGRWGPHALPGELHPDSPPEAAEGCCPADLRQHSRQRCPSLQPATPRKASRAWQGSLGRAKARKRTVSQDAVTAAPTALPLTQAVCSVGPENNHQPAVLMRARCSLRSSETDFAGLHNCKAPKDCNAVHETLRPTSTLQDLSNHSNSLAKGCPATPICAHRVGTLAALPLLLSRAWCRSRRPLEHRGCGLFAPACSGQGARRPRGSAACASVGLRPSLVRPAQRRSLDLRAFSRLSNLDGPAPELSEVLAACPCASEPSRMPGR